MGPAITSRRSKLPLSSSVDDEFASIIGQSFVIQHALDRKSLEVAQVLVDECVVFDVRVLPLAECPGGEPARTRAHLSTTI